MHCSIAISAAKFADAARSGRIASHHAQAEAKRSETQRRQTTARLGWVAAKQPAWLDSETYTQRIQPRLAEVPYAAIAAAIGVSLPYAAGIRAGRRLPHPRHWEALAGLAGVSRENA